MKRYEAPDVEICYLGLSDVITASTGNDGSDNWENDPYGNFGA